MRQWPKWRNGQRVNLRMTPRVMPLDVLKLRGILERRLVPVQVTHPLMHGRISRANIANVALEVLDVNGVEANQRDIQPNVRLGDVLAKVVRSVLLFAKVLLSTVERFKKGDDVALVGFGGGCEAGLVDAVVDEVIMPSVGFFDLGA